MTPEIFAFCTSCTAALLGSRLDTVTTIAAFSSIPEPDLVALAHEHTPPVRVVVGVDFDKAQLGNETARSEWIDAQVSRVQSLGIDGLNLDIEGNTANRDGLTALVAGLRAALSAANPAYQLSFDLGISPVGQTGGYDHRALSKEMDFTVPMAYDECWGAKVASANSPVPRLIEGMKEYEAMGVPPRSLVVGLPWYGWDFPCTEEAGATCSVDPPTGQPWFGYAKQLGYEEVVALARRADLSPTSQILDHSSMTKHFDYFTNSTDGSFQRHQVWYDDAVTLGAKYETAAWLGARGVAIWTANFGDDSMWEALQRFREGSTAAALVS